MPETTTRDLPGSRWRGAPKREQAGAADRVRASHRQARATVRLALVFVAGAAVAALVADGRWLPLHLLLAGGLVLAISGVSTMLTVTWSAAPAPGDRWAATQRWLVAAGAAGVAVGREAAWPSAAVGAAGAAHLLGQLLLAWLLVRTVRRGVERRFDVAVAAYVAGLTAGVAAVGVGITMAVDHPTIALRSAHVALNLLGLVGLVVGGTLPFFAATVGRTRLAPHATPRRLAGNLVLLGAALASAVAGIVAGARPLAVAGLLAYAAGIAAVVAALPRPRRRQLEWAGPRLVGLWCGSGWWAAAVVAAAVDTARGSDVLLGGRWLAVLVLAGYVQILWGSLAYLVPMLRGGGHERLSAGFRTTRSWAALVAANVAGVALVADLRAVAGAALTVWAVDTAARLATVLPARP